MRIAFFSGPLEYSVCLANGISKHHEVTFFYGVKNAKDRDSSILNLLDPSIKKCPTNSYRIRDIRNVFSYFYIARKLASYDIVHIQNGDVWLSFWRWLFRKVPMVFTVHDPYQHMGVNNFNKNYQDFAQWWGIRQSIYYIVHGKKLKVDLSQRYGISMGHIAVIEHGEFSIYKKVSDGSNICAPKKHGEKMILFFGIVRKNKGLEYLIKAEPFISKKYTNFKICIAGKFQNDRPEYERMILNKDKFEIINEFIPTNKVAALFEDADMVVLPYITATQSGVLPLAFGFGNAVIATSTGSLPEVIEDGKNGILIPPCQEKVLAEAILDLLNNESKCESLGRNAAQFAQTQLSWDRIAVQTLEIYRSMLK